jgi:hypothetical protein
MCGQEILQQKNFMRKWECGQKKDRWNTYYKMVEPPREKTVG